MEDGIKLRKFLEQSSKEKINKLIERLETLNDIELTELANYIKLLIR